MSTIAVSCACAPAAVASPSSAQATITVGNVGGKAAELLHRLTIAQLAAVLKTTPAELKAQIEGVNGQIGVELGELLTNPKATVQEVLDLLAAHGVSTTAVEQVINRLLAGGTETGEQLRFTIDEVLADLGEDGQIEQLAKELVLPPAVVEALHLAPTTVEQTASSLGTTAAAETPPLAPSTAERTASSLGATSGNLITTLLGAGSATQPGGSPLVASTLPGGGSVVVGMPSGNGGLTLTTINSTSSGRSAAAASSPSVSSAFTILSITVTRAGLIRETVSLPGPGQVAIGASTRRKLAFRSRNGHKRTATRTATLASVGETLSGGVHTITVRMRGAAARARPLAVKLSTTYTPTGGSPSTIQRSVTIRSAAKKRRR